MVELTRASRILADGRSQAVQAAAADLRRDLATVLTVEEARSANIELLDVPGAAPESYRVDVAPGGPVSLRVHAGDDLGFIYGLYAISRELLGVHDLWFWNDQTFERVAHIEVPDNFVLSSTPAAVRYRGWFLNDEVLLRAWTLDRSATKPWEMAFEALLRLGGNTVIPGTGTMSRELRALAAGRGLAITHHHAEPLGAEMFARAHPDLTPSFTEHPDEFRALWRRALDDQSGMNVLWCLAFRGQGDRPFWDDDPQYTTTQDRGALLTSLIREQYEMVKAHDPGAPTCVYLYGETMGLYREGHLELPGDVIKIWADNGFGAMVSRRQGNDNPRVPALPSPGDPGRNGIYYHASFYDLQAANHITALQNRATDIEHELERVLAAGADDLWIVNCSNVKPHVYMLELIAQMWRDGSVDVDQHRRRYSETYFGAQDGPAVAEVIASYADHAVAYGAHWDEHAGEQFPTYVPRMLASQYLVDQGASRSEYLKWATGSPDLAGQAHWLENLARQGMKSYGKYVDQCRETAPGLQPRARALFEASWLVQGLVYRHCFEASWHTAKSVVLALNEDWVHAFYEAGLARESFEAGDRALRDCERGKWTGFYANDCLTDVKQGVWVLDGLMAYLRNRGDGPHFYTWQREFLYPEMDRRVMLITNFENHLDDQAIFALMKAAIG